MPQELVNWFGWDGGQWKEDSALCLSERLGGGIMTDTGNMGNKLWDIVSIKSILEWSCENAYNSILVELKMKFRNYFMTN